MVASVCLEVVGTHEFELLTDGTLIIRGKRELVLEPELVSELASFLRIVLAQAMIQDAERIRDLAHG